LYSGTHPPAQIVPQTVALAGWSARVDDERLDDPQQVLGELVEICVAETETGPIDIKLAQHRVGEVLRDV
jgi:hypothetical protein